MQWRKPRQPQLAGLVQPLSTSRITGTFEAIGKPGSRVYIHASSVAGKKYGVDFRAHSHREFEHRMSFDLQPNLKGELIELRPLTPEDWDDLFAVASDALIWEQHPERDRYKEDVFKNFFREALECGGAFVIIDKKSQKIIGSTRFYGYAPEKSEIEIGWTFLAQNEWGGNYNRELKQLMLAHAFQFVESVIFYVGENNVRSQKATEKIGAVKNGLVKKADHSDRFSFKYVIKKPQ